MITRLWHWLSETCSNCNGTGRDGDQACVLCGGSGTIPDPGPFKGNQHA